MAELILPARSTLQTRLRAPDLLAPNRYVSGAMRIKAEWLAKGLKAAWTFGPNGPRDIAFGRDGVISAGVSYGPNYVQTAGNTSSYILLPVFGAATNPPYTFVVDSERISGAVSWSYLRNSATWYGIYCESQNIKTSNNNSFDGLVSPSGYGAINSTIAVSHSSNNLRASLRGGPVTQDTSAIAPTTINRNFLTIGCSFTDVRGNASVVRARLVLSFDQILSDADLVVLSANPNIVFESANQSQVLISIPGGAETINADFISAATSIYEPSLTTGAVTISVDFISAATSVYEPTVSAPSGAQDITADFISSTTSVHEPTLTVGAVSIAADFISSVTTVHEPTLTAGAVAISADFVAAVTSVYEPTVFSGSAIVPDFIASTTSVYEPIITTGAVTLVADLIAAGTIVYEPSLSSAVNISADFVAAVTVVHEPTVGVGAVTILADFISSGTIVYEPSVPFGQIISADFIAALSAVYEPSVTDAATIWIEITPVSTIWTEI